MMSVGTVARGKECQIEKLNWRTFPAVCSRGLSLRAVTTAALNLYPVNGATPQACTDMIDTDMNVPRGLGLTGFAVFKKYPANIAALAHGAVEATNFFRKDNVMLEGTALNST